MFKARLKDSVTPSGVKFVVRALKGKDQSTLTEVSQSGDQSSISSIDKMLSDCLINLGDKSESEITPKVVSGLLSNDRKFILVTLRQHTLKYKKLFEFKFEWPIEGGNKNKEVQDYSINFTSENFPVTPYWWVNDEIKKQTAEDPNYAIPDGHDELFPVVFEKYRDMMDEHQLIEGKFDDGTEYRWKMMDGHMEKNLAALKKVNVNTPLEQRSIQYLFGSVLDQEKSSGAKEPVWTIFNVDDADVMDLEQLRFELFEKEGTVDTSLTIQHQTNPLRQMKVDLIQIPAFFFPSLGR